VGVRGSHFQAIAGLKQRYLVPLSASGPIHVTFLGNGRRVGPQKARRRIAVLPP